MVIYATIISVLLVVSFLMNCVLIQFGVHLIKENKSLEEDIKCKG